MKKDLFDLNRALVFATLSYLLCGCAALEAKFACTEEPYQLFPQSKPIYLIPKKDLVITVAALAKKEPANFSIQSGTAYPDASKRFLTASYPVVLDIDEYSATQPSV